MKRRQAIKLIGLGALASVLPRQVIGSIESNSKLKISLAQWSLHRAFTGDVIEKKGWNYFVSGVQSGEKFKGAEDPINFASIARNVYGLDAIEYVNSFFFTQAKNTKYLSKLKQSADENGVKNLLIMVDLEGRLGAPDKKERQQAIENHYKWIDAAAFLGCHSIRINATSSGSYEEQKKLAIDGVRRLSEHAAEKDINVIIENHGGLSSNARWLTEVIKGVGLGNCGSLPDFGNFKISDTEQYDPYVGTKELLPFAKGVSAKSFNFDQSGNETTIDYKKMVSLVKESGYEGYIGIEYEGNKLSEFDGIMATKKLLQRHI